MFRIINNHCIFILCHTVYLTFWFVLDRRLKKNVLCKIYLKTQNDATYNYDKLHYFTQLFTLELCMLCGFKIEHVATCVTCL